MYTLSRRLLNILWKTETSETLTMKLADMEAAAVLSSAPRRAFHVLTITLLSLLLPLSFLLLARLSTANFSFSLMSSSPQQIPFLLSLFFHPGNPNPIHAVVLVISVSALLHGLTGWTLFVAKPPATTAAGERSGLYVAWALLCALHVSVGLGVEGSILSGAGASPSSIAGRSLLTSRAFFFLGLHGTMAHWCGVVVKPVVDDTVYGAAGEARIRRWPEKVAMMAAYGWLWWWGLRDEVESMVIAPQAKKDLSIGLGVADFVGWWLYYLTVAIGVVRLVRGMLWVASPLLCRRERHKFEAINCEQEMV